jgi:two-component system chemotaxis response regulator CheB
MIRVLIVDDSATVRHILRCQLAASPDLEVVGAAADAWEARDMIVRLRPDVLTLDLQMPGLDGLAFLDRLMQHFPLPVVIVSGVAPEHGSIALQALELGAVDVVPKPADMADAADFGVRLTLAVHNAALARPQAPIRAAPATGSRHGWPSPANGILLVGASTGGTRAIEYLLGELPADGPPILVVQHLPPAFIASFAARLTAQTRFEARVAQNGDEPRRGLVLVAPGDRHMTVVRRAGRLRVRLRDWGPIHHQRCAVDPLFASAARAAGASAIAVLLTGMGTDGARGMLRLRHAGALTIAEAAESCVVFGMPREAIRIGAASAVAHLQHIPALLARALDPVRAS